MNKWFEIFRTGTHTASNGTTKTWTTDDLDKLASSYDAEKNPAPLVVGHPEQNAPAYGWAQAIKRQGDKLLALPEKVEEAFAAMVKDGRFPKRSISVNPDGTLRHIGFLGATPPAIKGLKDVEFSGGQGAETYEYAEHGGGMTVEELQRKLEAEKEARKAAESKFTEEKRRAERLETEFGAHKQSAAKKEIDDFIEAGIKEATILPAWKDKGLGEFMASLQGEEQTYEFSEGKKQNRLEWFKDFLADFASHPLFKEMVPEDGGRRREKDDYAEDEALAKEIAAGKTGDS